MPRRAAVKSPIPTRERMLDAAILWFSRHSYEATGLRDIAALAEVDVAYVHRSFGSKQKLFAEAIGARLRPDELLQAADGDIASLLAAFVFAQDGATDRGEVGPFDIMNHSLSSAEARDIMRDFITQKIIPLFAAKLDRVHSVRAASLIVAYLAGMGLLRNVIDIEPLRDGAGGWLEAASKGIITAILTQSPSKEDHSLD